MVLYRVKGILDHAKCSAQALMVVTTREDNHQICARGGVAMLKVSTFLMSTSRSCNVARVDAYVSRRKHGR